MINNDDFNPIPDAYDAEGRPLFYHPPTPEQPGAGSTPVKSHLNKDLVKLRHDRSVQDFPGLDLDHNEFVEVFVKRHPIGKIAIWISEVVLGVALAALLVILLSEDGPTITTNEDSTFYMMVSFAAVFVLLILSGWIGVVIYKSNELIVTNKRVVQRITTSLFDKTLQTIDLASVEDVSYKQTGIIQTVFGYGTIRLSTIGDESTYQFTFVDDPSSQTDDIRKIVQSTKMSLFRSKGKAGK
jgi:hypothetical protein